MEFIDKMLVLFGFADREDDEDDEENEMPVQKQRGEVHPVANNRTNNIVAFNQTKEPTYVAANNTAVAETAASARVILVEPTRFEESQSIADNLLNHKAVVINIENCNAEIAAKIIDFVGGVVYAIDGSIQKVSQGIVLAAPANIDIASELKTDGDFNNDEIFAWVTKYNHRGEF